jgi:heat shock protein HtpX
MLYQYRSKYSSPIGITTVYMEVRSSWKKTLIGLFLNWIIYYVVVGFIVDSMGILAELKSGTLVLVTTAVALFPLLVSVVSGIPSEDAIAWSFVIGWIPLVIGIGIFLARFIIDFSIAILTYSVWNPVVSGIDHIVATPVVTGSVVFGLAGILVVGSLLIAWKTGPAVDWSLSLRMVALPLVLIVLLIGFFTAIWRLIDLVVWIGLVLLGSDPDTGGVVIKVVAVGLLATLVFLEYYRISAVEQHGDASTVTADEYPALHSITTRVASQLDIPVPTIAITGRSEPEAITVGYRPGSITLILSQGTLTALNDEELEAVVAHELAHVANMDAMVMTAASLPSLLADSLAGWALAELLNGGSGNNSGFIGKTIANVRRKGPQNLIWLALLIITLLTKIVSFPFIISLSRTRESAADSTAATVTGSPAALASALRTLDERIDEMPSEDLREASDLSSLSILPLDPEAVFETHPPTDRRIDVLTSLSEECGTES